MVVAYVSTVHTLKHTLTFLMHTNAKPKFSMDASQSQGDECFPTPTKRNYANKTYKANRPKVGKSII